MRGWGRAYSDRLPPSLNYGFQHSGWLTHTSIKLLSSLGQKDIWSSGALVLNNWSCSFPTTSGRALASRSLVPGSRCPLILYSSHVTRHILTVTMCATMRRYRNSRDNKKLFLFHRVKMAKQKSRLTSRFSSASEGSMK